jgi:peroxiredoxin family protein
MSLVRCPRREVERRLGVGGEHEQGVAGPKLGHAATSEHQRERAGEAARVERGHDEPIMSGAPPQLAVVLATGELERFYSGLSVLVSTASEGHPVAGLAVFRGLELLLDENLLQRALDPSRTPSLSWSGRETFAQSLHELRETALEMPALCLYACSASVDTMGLSPTELEARLDGVRSTPRFLHETAEARLLYV